MKHQPQPVLASVRWLPHLAICAALILTPASLRGELRFAGSLGNSGDSAQTLVTFQGRLASGMGPILDDAGTLWERGGSRQLNRYALDGRLLACFALPDSTDRADQLTRAGGQLVMKLGKALYALPLDAVPGAAPRRLAGGADVLSSNAFESRLAVADQDVLFWLDATTGTREEIVKADFHVQALCFDADGTLFGFGGGQVFAWKNAQAVAGFPRGFHGERPQKIGRYWFSHAWHGTINRFNEAFEPAPGVVLGGASGTFIGYLPQSADVTNGRGMVRIRDGLYAISGLGGVVQFLQWNEAESRFEPVRRIGALLGIGAVALDAAGNIWTPRGSWRWSDTSDTPHSLGDKEPDACAQPVVLDGKTLCLLKKHYSYVQLARGPLLDAQGLSHFETPGLEGLELTDAVSGAAAVADGQGLRMVVVERGGAGWEFGITADGRRASPPRPLVLCGLKNCTSLAWFQERLLAADGGEIVVFQQDAQRGWNEVSRLGPWGDRVFIHSDGKRLAVSDAAAGAVRLFASLTDQVAVYEGLEQPAQLAVCGDRVAVYESGRQRLVKLEWASPGSAPQLVAQPVSAPRANAVSHLEADFRELGRAGGIPFAVALTQTADGLAVSLRTAAEPVPQVTLGIANEQQAFTLTEAQARRTLGQFDFALPPGDWSAIRLAATVTFPNQRERFGFLDHQPIHAPFNADPAVWTPFDLVTHRELVAERRQEIRIGFEQPGEGKATIVIEDEAGRRVRNLVSGQAFAAGRQSVVWDGLDDRGTLVAPGTYRWRGVTHPGIRPRYRMCFANGGEGTLEPWGPNHSTLHHAAANRELVFLAAPVTEGGWALLALDADGNWVQGYEHQHGLGIQHNAIAADERYLYCAQDGFAWGGTKGLDLGSDRWRATWKVTVTRYDIRTGKLVEFPGGKRFVEVDAMEVGPGANRPGQDEFNLGGIAVCEGRLYVGSRDERAVLVLDAASGQPVGRIPLEGVRHLAAGQEAFAATDQGVVRLRDQQLVVPAQGMDLAGIALAPEGEILVSDAVSHQIHRFTAAGQPCGSIGKPGGPYCGAYDPERMVNPRGLVFGPDGKLWVSEQRENPKRVLAWDLARQRVVYEKFGMPPYGGSGAGFDPEQPGRWIGLGCLWQIDLEHGAARPTHVLSRQMGHLGGYQPMSYSFFREAGRTFVSTRGKIALIAELLSDGTLRDIAATAGTHHFAYGFDWNPPQAYIDAFYARWPEKRAQEKPGQKGEGKPWAQRGMGVLWVDRNGDGGAQQDEFDFCGDKLEYGGGSWGHLQHSLTLYLPVADGTQVSVVALQPKGFLSHGVPDYPTLDQALARALPVRLTPGYKRSGVATVRDRFGRFIFNSDPELNAYAADGSHVWSYPNQWSDVHGSHDAPLPEPGMIQGALAILGIAPWDDRGDLFFLNGNHGRCFLLTSDGLYLDEAFVDVRVSYLKNEYRLGGEIFGGSFGRAVDGKCYVQIGHGPYRIYELTGLDRMRRMAGEVTVSSEQILAAERRRLRHSAARQQERRATVPGTIRWDKSGRFRAQLDLAADASHLHLTYRVEDPSPWINNGRDWTKLFATGDSVDLQIGTDAHADPQRKQPVAGDLRILIAPFDGQPIAVLYDYRKPGGANPIEFTSPWRGERVDHVQQLTAARLAVSVESGGYTVRASLPFKDLGLVPAAGSVFRADFGVTFGDAAGTDTNLRSCWSNQSTGLVDDLPGEMMLRPNLWGRLEFR